jgi:hypothetical protein
MSGSKRKTTSVLGEGGREGGGECRAAGEEGGRGRTTHLQFQVQCAHPAAGHHPAQLGAQVGVLDIPLKLGGQLRRQPCEPGCVGSRAGEGSRGAGSNHRDR